MKSSNIKIKDVLFLGFIVFCGVLTYFGYKGNHLQSTYIVIFSLIAGFSLIYGLMSLGSYLFLKMEIKEGSYEKITANAVGFSINVGSLLNSELKREIMWGFKIGDVNYHPEIKNKYLIDKHNLNFDLSSTTEFYYKPSNPNETIWCFELEDSFGSFCSSMVRFVPFFIGMVILLCI